MRIALVLGLLASLSTPSLAQVQKPDPRDAAVIVQCLKSAAAKGDKQDRCVGVVSTPCLQDDKTNSTTLGMESCGDREFAVWNNLLERAILQLRRELDGEQRAKLDAMQDAWSASLAGSCSFYRDYFKGTMAGPLIAQCMSDETGRRVLFLFGFIDDTGFLDGNNGK